MSLIFNKSQLIDQRQDRNILRWQESYIAAKRDESAAHVGLVNGFIRDFADGGETLKFFRFIIFQFWGIKDHPIARLHPLQGRGFAMIGLDKSASQSALKMVLGCNNDPVFHKYLAPHPYEKTQETNYQCQSDKKTKIIFASRIVDLIHPHVRIEK